MMNEYVTPKNLEHGLDLIDKCCGAIDFTDANINDSRLVQVLDAMRERDSVNRLRLNSNKIGTKGAVALGNFLAETKALEELELNKNYIGSDGLKGLCEGLKANTSLLRLCIAKNQIKNDGGQALASILMEHHVLQFVKVDGNFLTKESIVAFIAALENNTEVIYLSLHCEALKDEDVLKLVDEKVSRNKTLRDEAQREQQKMLVSLSNPHAKRKGPWRRCKLMVVGQGRAGKTGTVRSLLGMRFDHNLESTIVGAITEVGVRQRGWDRLDQDDVPLDNATAVALGLARNAKGIKFKETIVKEKREEEKKMLLQQRENHREREIWEEQEVETMTPEKFRMLSPIKKTQMRDMMQRVRQRQKARGGAKLKPLAKKEEPVAGGVKKIKEEFSRSELLRRSKQGNAKNNVTKQTSPVNSALNEEDTNEVKISAEEFRKLGPAEKKKMRALLKAQKERKKDKTKLALNEHKLANLTQDGKLFKAATSRLPSIRFSIWDLGGQTVFHTIHHLFVSDCAIYLLVVDMRKLVDPEGPDEEVKEHLAFWVRTLRVHAPGCPVVIAGTFLDELEDMALINNEPLEVLLKRVNKNLKNNLNLEEETIEMNEERDLIFFPIDNRNNKGVQKLKWRLQETGEKQPFINVSVDLRWLRCLDELMSDNRHRFMEKTPIRSADSRAKAVQHVNNESQRAARTLLVQQLRLDPTYAEMEDNELINVIAGFISEVQQIANPDIAHFVERMREFLAANADALRRELPEAGADEAEDAQLGILFRMLLNGQAQLQPITAVGNIAQVGEHPEEPPFDIDDPIAAENENPDVGEEDVGIFRRVINWIRGAANNNAEEERMRTDIARLLAQGPVDPNQPVLVANNMDDQPEQPVGETMGKILKKMYVKEDFKGWISLDYIKNLAASFGITSDKEVESMLSLFHRLGAIFYLDSSEALRDVVTVDIMWLISAVGKVIRDPSLHRENLDMEEIEKFALEPDVERMFDQALVSYDLLSFFWTKQSKVNFLIELMKKALLLSEWKFGSNVGNDLFLVPSLLTNTATNLELLKIEMNDSNNFRARFDFAGFNLLDGVYERMVCLLIGLESVAVDEPPVVMKNICKIFFKTEKVGELSELFLRRENESIICSFANASLAGYNRILIDKLLVKIRGEISLQNFEWSIQVELKDENKFVPLEEAIKKNIHPWAGENGKQANSLSIFDLGDFIGTF